MFNTMGVEMELLLREAAIPPRAIANDKFQVSTDQYKKLVKAMDKYSDLNKIVEISIVDSIASFNPEFFAGLCAENGLECIRRISKYKSLIAPVQMVITEDDEKIYITYIYNDGSSLPRMLYTHAQISILSILRKGTGVGDLKPESVIGELEYPQVAEEYFKVKAKVDDNNQIAFLKSDLKRAFVTKNNRMWDCLEKELDQRLRELETDQSYSAMVRNTLIELLPAGYSDAEKISYELGVSKRTLQRRLKDENTTFNQQLNHTRELMVRNYLKMDMCLDEIAFLVNYSDAKALSRAFKVWTGMSITIYRRQLLA